MLVLIAGLIAIGLFGVGVLVPPCTACPTGMQSIGVDLCVDVSARGPDDSFANAMTDCATRGLAVCPANTYDRCLTLDVQTVIPFESDCGDPTLIGGNFDDFWTTDFVGPPGVGDHTCVSGNTAGNPAFFFPVRVNCDTGTQTSVFWHCCAPQQQCVV